MVKKTKSKNDISLDKNISDSFTKLPELRLGEQFVVQSLGVVELHLELFSGESFAPGDNYNILFLTFLGHVEMKHLLITTIAAVLLVGCEKSAFEQEFDRTLTKINKAEESLSEASRALMAAVKEGNIEAVKQHLDDGADVNAEGGLGTPLHFAADEGHKEIAELLIAKGADVNVKTEDGLTPLDRAIKYQRTETADLLRKHGGKTGEELKAKGN